MIFFCPVSIGPLGVGFVEVAARPAVARLVPGIALVMQLGGAPLFALFITLRDACVLARSQILFRFGLGPALGLDVADADVADHARSRDFGHCA